MQTKTMCQSVTRQGRSCRNPALANTDPPVCWRHKSRTPSKFRQHEAIEPAMAGASSRTLTSELVVVRQVLQRLVEQLEQSAFAAEADELRKLAALIFSGARTVAYLLQQQSGRDADAPDWLDEALNVLKSDYGVEL